MSKERFVALRAAHCVFHNRGWEIIAQPGESVILQKDETAFHHFEVTEQLESGSLSSEEWKRICDLAGVADSDLGEMAGKANS